MAARRLLPKLLPVGFGLAALAVAWLYGRPQPSTAVVAAATSVEWRAGQMLEVGGTVSRLLADDREGSRHQRFILTLDDDRTLLVAHNIDLAPRVPLAAGDTVRVRGQYETNERGGLLHWTHRDPEGRRRDTGWIELDGKVYE